MDTQHGTTRQGAVWFEILLATGWVPGVSLLLGLFAVSTVGRTDSFRRRIVAMLALDAAIFAGLLVAVPFSLRGDHAEPPIERGPRLGVLLDPAHKGPGARVLRVLPSSPAARRLKPGDLVLDVDGRSVEDHEDLVRTIRAGAEGQSRALRVRRGPRTSVVGIAPTMSSFSSSSGEESAREASSSCKPVGILEAWPGGTAGFLVLVVALVAIALLGLRVGAKSITVALSVLAVMATVPLADRAAVWIACSTSVAGVTHPEALRLALSELAFAAASVGLVIVGRRRFALEMRSDGESWTVHRTIAVGVMYAVPWLLRAALLAFVVRTALSAWQLEAGPMIGEAIQNAARSRPDRLLVLLGVAVLAPVAEECIFRGVLLPHLSRIVRPWTAIYATAIAFGAMHASGHGAFFFGPAVLGGILGWARMRSNGLIAPIAMHVGFNTVGTVGLLLMYELQEL